MGDAHAFFDRDGESLVPRPLACSLWSDNQMHGVATSSALARAVEAEVTARGREDLQPARYTVDLFRPATMEPFSTVATTVREGRRIMLVDVTLVQRDQVVARAGAVLLKPTESPEEEVWSAGMEVAPPPVELSPPADEPRVPFFWSEKAGWSQDFAAHQNGSRKMLWQTIPRVVPDEPLTAFVAAAGVADATSMVTNWGTGGVQWINSDITLALARLPVGREIGLAALDHLDSAGIAVGTAVVFDRQGPVGTSVVTALSNARRAIDFEAVHYTDEGHVRAHPGA